MKMNSPGIISREKTVFVLVDIQEKFIPVVHNIDQVISNTNILIRASEILNIPLIVTEQYPKGLGMTWREINLPDNPVLFEKIHFSCFGCDEFSKKIEEMGAESIVLFGIETHVCVLQTALDALKNNITVYLVSDAVSSRTPENKSIAIERMRQSGIFIVSTEMILFQLLERAGTGEFRLISDLVK